MEHELFLKRLASLEPAPGGGSAAATAGSMAAALLAMTAKLSIKNHSSAAEISTQAETWMEASTRLAREDEKAFDKVAASYQLPKQTESEKAVRHNAVQESLKAATETPLESAKTALEILRKAEMFLPKANRNAVSDLGVCALLADAALEGAVLNVFINLASIKDQAYVKQRFEDAEQIVLEGKKRSDKILTDVRKLLRAPLGTCRGNGIDFNEKSI